MTRPFRKILCPVDFSRHSQHALRYAALLASRTGAQLTALFVEDPLLSAAAAGTGMSAKTRAQLQRFVERTVAPFAVDRGSIVVQTTAGKPYREITRAAEQSGCDLIVIGAHGVTGAAKMMLGSTTERVLRHAEVPVLAIPPPKSRAAAALSRGWPERQAAAPVELGPHLSHDATMAAGIAAQLGTRLILLNVTPPHDRDRSLKAHARLERLVKQLKSNAVTGCRVFAGKPDEQIAAMAADVDVDLVILTRRRGKGLFGARLGTISYRVLCDAETPVMALPSSGAWLRRQRLG